ncbi:MAG: cytochrome d ubiquinol oxidase subunit II [Acidobacteriota bacterium]
METVWFSVVTFLITGYVVLDGFDLGAGILHLWVARTPEERRQVLGSIGPIWDGNEVWLVVAAGVLFFAFPALYAASFSGFYLPLMIVLWLFMLRGVAIEFRGHVDSALWKHFWDVGFSASSALLALFLGAALGNIVRGVPLNAEGYFFEPLWTDLRPGPPTGILDWFTIAVGLLAFCALTQHGALWLMVKTEGALRDRARHVVGVVWWWVVALTGLVTFLTFAVQPWIPRHLAERPWGSIFPALALAGLFAVRWLARRAQAGKAFLASCAYLAGMLASAALGLYPLVLPANNDPALGLTVRNASAPGHGLAVGLAWFVPGMILVAGYFTFLYSRFRGVVSRDDEGY